MKKNNCLVFVVLAASIASTISSACADISIAGIAPGMSADSVQKILGSPRKITSGKHGFIAKQFDYDRLGVSFDEDMRVAGIESHNPKYCFKQWLCPGITEATVKSQMPGRKFVTTASKGKLTIYDDSCWADITSNHGSIESVAILCQP